MVYPYDSVDCCWFIPCTQIWLLIFTTMSNKVNINLVAETLKRHKLEPAVLREIIEELNAAAKPETETVDSGPKSKKEFVILADSSGTTGWVLQISADSGQHTIIDRINRAAHDFNNSKAGRLLPVKTVAEALESVKRKFMKEADVLVKTRIPVSIIKTNNKLSEPPSI